MLRDLLAPSVTIEVPMAAAFRDEDAALVELTREQSLLLAHMARNPRMAVFGCAGSGKTMLAVEHARRLADGGADVLFVCFNKALAAHLATTEKHERLTFTGFHRLCVRLARQAGVELPDEAIDRLGEQWDALDVDEAQDLHDDWLAALRYGLRDERRAPVWLFLDDNQRVYDEGLRVPDDFVRWDLGTNCRNTQAIHRELLKLYDGAVAPDVRGPAGRAPELLHSDDQPATVAAILDRLLGRDDVPPGDVVVLSSHGREKSTVAEALAARLTFEAPKRGDRRVRFSSIRGFKGLESPVVVLCELEDLDRRTRDQQLYVGMSRARNHCIVVAPPAVSDGG
jgi:superfamily I DNA/RNA helicase